MLELKGVSYRYPSAEHPALQAIDLQLAPGDCLGLLGSNGAGKTTLLSLIAGLLPLQQGELRWAGSRQIGLVPQQPAFYAGLTVAENLALFADLYRLKGSARRTRLERALAGTCLDELQRQRAGRLSGGQQRRLNFAIGLLQPADLYLFDEATVGVDAHSRQVLLQAVEALTEEGAAVIYTSHYLEEVERVAQRILLLEQGRIRLDVDKRQLLSDEQGLLLEWPEQPPAGLEGLLAGLGLSAQPLPAGYQLQHVDPAQLAGICQFLASQPQAPSLLRYGRPSLEQLYLRLNGGKL